MIITDRDRQLIADIQSYGIFTTRQIASRHFSGVRLTTVLRRLRALERERHIQRIPGLDGGSFGWALTKEAVEKFQFTSAKVHFPRAILDHDVKLTDLRLCLEDVGVVRSWTPEHEIRSRLARK